MSEPFQLRHPVLSVGVIAFVVSAVLLFLLTNITLQVSPFRGCILTVLETRGIQPIDMTSDASFCFLHDTPIHVKVVPIVYGLLQGPFPTEQDRRKFPFCSTWISGGCCVAAATHAIVSQCTKCVELRRQWNSTHPLPSDRYFDSIKPKPAMGTPAISFEEMIIPCYVIE